MRLSAIRFSSLTHLLHWRLATPLPALSDVFLMLLSGGVIPEDLLEFFARTAAVMRCIGHLATWSTANALGNFTDA